MHFCRWLHVLRNQEQNFFRDIILNHVQDYGAPVNESRAITEKHAELKLQSLFLRSFKDLRMTDLISKHVSILQNRVFYTALMLCLSLILGEDNSTVPSVTTTRLQNPSTNSSFYITRHTDTTVK
jgi:hypothetical protein